MTLSDWVVMVILPAHGLALVLGFIRLLRGPTVPDRILALDLLTSLGIGLGVATAILVEQRALIDVVLVVTLLAFLGAVAWSRYMEVRRS